MSADSPGIWRQAAELFDELAPLAPAERRAMLANRDVSPQVRQWLEELLAAHDGDQTTIIDREIDRLVEGMVPEAWGGREQRGASDRSRVRSLARHAQAGTRRHGTRSGR